MGQVQRRKRKFRESMRREGERVPSLQVAARRAWLANIYRGAQIATAYMDALRVRRQAMRRDQSPGEPVFLAPMTLHDPSMPAFLAAMVDKWVTVYFDAKSDAIKAHASVNRH